MLYSFCNFVDLYFAWQYGNLSFTLRYGQIASSPSWSIISRVGSRQCAVKAWLLVGRISPTYGHFINIISNRCISAIITLSVIVFLIALFFAIFYLVSNHITILFK